MARYTDAKCRLCRREGAKLFLKGTRCETVKCSWHRREKVPGMHNWQRGKVSDYKKGLREKQKVKRFYGLLERQFKRYFRMAEIEKGNTGMNLLKIIETRLDNAVLRGGFALSRAQGRQLVCHGHIKVNGKRVDIPSYLLKTGDVITVQDRENSKKQVKENMEQAKTREPVSWLAVNEAGLEITVVKEPTREDVSIPIEEQLVVELLSR